MKKILFSMLAMAAMVSCSNENEQIDGINGKVEIKLNAGVVSTKAPIDSENNLPKADVSLQIVQAPDDAIATWTGISTVAATPTLKTTGTIDFDNTNALYYNADETKKSHLLAYSPSGTITSGSVEWLIDGSNDIIIAKAVSGSKAAGETIDALSFEHLLTQLQIEIKGDAAAASTFGTAIRSIKIKDALTKPKMTFGDTKITTLDWTNIDKANLDVLETGKDTPVSTGNINTSGIATAIGYIMLQPTTSYTLLISTDKITDKEVVVALAAAAGNAHKITITFSATAIEPTATLTGWVDGAVGNGTVD